LGRNGVCGLGKGLNGAWARENHDIDDVVYDRYSGL